MNTKYVVIGNTVREMEVRKATLVYKNNLYSVPVWVDVDDMVGVTHGYDVCLLFHYLLIKMKVDKCYEKYV